MKKLFLYFEQGYLTDYFVSVAVALNKKFVNKIVLGSAIELTKLQVETVKINKLELATLPYSYVWTTVDLLPFVSISAFKICTVHHAGYGENLFIPNFKILALADVFLCCTFSPEIQFHEGVFSNLVEVKDKRQFSIVPIGYPKFDHCWHHCQAQKVKTSIMVALTDINDIHYDALKQLRICFQLLLENTEDTIIFRPFPRDLNLPKVKKLISEFSASHKFLVSEGSYIDCFSSSKLMIFLGRKDATTAYTYAYSTETPVLFIEPSISKKIQERDIGYSIQDAEYILEGLGSAENSSPQKRIIKSRTKNIQYVGQSLKRIENTVEHFCFDQNKPLTAKYTFRIDNNAFQLKQALKQLEQLVEIVASYATQYCNSYAINDYVKQYLSSNTIHLSLQAQVDLLNFLMKIEGKLLPNGFIDLAFQILHAFNEFPKKVASPFFRSIIELTYKHFSSVSEPTEQFAFKTLRLLNLLGETKLSKTIVEKLQSTDSPIVMTAIIQWYSRINSRLLIEMTLKYLNCVGYWDLKKLTACCNESPYSFFGDGDSTRHLMVFIEYYKLPKPKCIFSSIPKTDYISGISIKHISEYKKDEYLIIVSPTAYKDIEKRLLVMGIETKQLINIVS